MKISELIGYLKLAQDRHGDAEVLCTWESVDPAISAIYWNGAALLLDSDNGFYMDDKIAGGEVPFFVAAKDEYD